MSPIIYYSISHNSITWPPFTNTHEQPRVDNSAAACFIASTVLATGCFSNSAAYCSYLNSILTSGRLGVIRVQKGTNFSRRHSQISSLVSLSPLRSHLYLLPTYWQPSLGPIQYFEGASAAVYWR